MIKAVNKTYKKRKKLIVKFGLYALGLIAAGIIIWLLYYYIRFYSYDDIRNILALPNSRRVLNLHYTGSRAFCFRI